ncbi:hypothetical protein ACFO3D_00875 [Virgibacillus kekensis]|uniref:Uncharacterized protein n=1 Tax=Virgibacillus kekensis TaxID=202261 RepID=A0ABV9DD87_9BACI
MNLVEVFEKQVIETNQQKMNDALYNLKHNNSVQRNFRELADNNIMLERITLIIKESSLMDEDRKHWLTKRDELNKRRERAHLELLQMGFEESWIKTLVESEMKTLKSITDKARNAAYNNYFGTTSIDEIDIFDERWVQVEEYMKNVKANFIEGIDPA